MKNPMDLCNIDFARSYLFFRTTGTDHTPRLQIHAVCSLGGAGRSRHYYLTRPCIAEAMYVETGLIHDPASEFTLIAALGEEFVMSKRFASASRDVHGAFRIGDAVPTHNGHEARII